MAPPAALKRALLETLAYSDIFEYPLRLAEVHRFLPMRATLDEVRGGLERAAQADCRDGFYFLAGQDDNVAIRRERESASRPTLERAVRIGRILGSLPFVRMAALTGSLAVLNLSKGADMDYMLVTAPRHLWTTRAFAMIFRRLILPFGDTICVNIIVSENALAWPLHDLYSAREMCQMIPITGLDVYHRLRAANTWTEEVLPNAGPDAPAKPTVLPYEHRDDVSGAVVLNGAVEGRAHLNELFESARPSTTGVPSAQGGGLNKIETALQKIIEPPLRGKYGDRLEAWAMKFQLHRIGHHAGTSDEVNFSADVCQGNFHHHRHWAGKYFHQRLVSLGLADGPRKSPRGYP